MNTVAWSSFSVRWKWLISYQIDLIFFILIHKFIYEYMYSYCIVSRQYSLTRKMYLNSRHVQHGQPNWYDRNSESQTLEQISKDFFSIFLFGPPAAPTLSALLPAL